jgi:hypothetical protein
MFKDCNAKQINFYKRSKDAFEEKKTQTEVFDVEYQDNETQCVVRNDFESQTDIREMLGSVIDNKYDMPSLEAFLKRVMNFNLDLFTCE